MNTDKQMQILYSWGNIKKIKQNSMLQQSRTIPPVPKFNIAFTTPTNDIVSKRRLKAIQRELDSLFLIIAASFPAHSIDIEKQTHKLLAKPQVIHQLRQKKYSTVAKALIIHAVNSLSLPIRNTTLYEVLGNNEKQIKKILRLLFNASPYQQKPNVYGFLEKICYDLGFNANFISVCSTLYQQLYDKQLIQGQHDHVISATLIKLAGDVVFHRNGGLNLNFIIKSAGCCELSLKNLLRKILPHSNELLKELLEYYDQNPLK